MLHIRYLNLGIYKILLNVDNYHCNKFNIYRFSYMFVQLYTLMQEPEVDLVDPLIQQGGKKIMD